MKTSLFFLFSSTLLVSCGSSSQSRPTSLQRPERTKYIVELQDGAQVASFQNDFLGFTIVNRYSHLLNGVSLSLSEQEAKSIATSDGVKNIHSVKEIQLHGVQKNPHWNLDWADQTKKRRDYSYSFRSTGKGVVVYTVDTGVFAAHPEFEGRARAGFDTTPERGTALENIDGVGHGTHVAGLVASKSFGIAKEVELVAVKVFNSKGQPSDTDTVLAGLEWIVSDRANHQKPSVVNMSLGGAGDDVLDSAVRKLIAEGIIVVVSAGNDNSSACQFSPAREPSAITVTAIQSNGLKPLYANFGRCVDLIAPGEGVTSTWKNGRTEIWGGTSQAAPQVSAAAAIYLEEHPTAQQNEISDFLIAKSISKGIVMFPQSTPLHLLNLSWNLP